MQWSQTLALTPALSPREREERAKAAARLTFRQPFPAGGKRIPSPGGEGQGEGERFSHRFVITLHET